MPFFLFFMFWFFCLKIEQFPSKNYTYYRIKPKEIVGLKLYLYLCFFKIYLYISFCCLKYINVINAILLLGIYTDQKEFRWTLTEQTYQNSTE